MIQDCVWKAQHNSISDDKSSLSHHVFSVCNRIYDKHFLRNFACRVNNMTDETCAETESRVNNMTDATCTETERRVNNMTDETCTETESRVNNMTDETCTETESRVNNMTDETCTETENIGLACTWSILTRCNQKPGFSRLAGTLAGHKKTKPDCCAYHIKECIISVARKRFTHLGILYAGIVLREGMHKLKVGHIMRQVAHKQGKLRAASVPVQVASNTLDSRKPVRGPVQAVHLACLAINKSEVDIRERIMLCSLNEQGL
jgi:hypothetical protein